MPTFLDVENERQQEQASLEDYFVEYDSQSQIFKDHLSFQYFFHLKDRRRPRQQYRDGGFFHNRHHTMGRLFFPKFDGSSSSFSKAWVEKLDIYFQLKKFPKVDKPSILQCCTLKVKHTIGGSMGCLHWAMPMWLHILN